MIEGMLAGGGLVFLGVILGRFLPARKRGPKSSSPGPVCGCGHHRSFHDARTAECHGIRKGYSYARCTCRQYNGPEPLPEYYAPELPS